LSVRLPNPLVDLRSATVLDGDSPDDLIRMTADLEHTALAELLRTRPMTAGEIDHHPADHA
jgi:hypothetical protein